LLLLVYAPAQDSTTAQVAFPVLVTANPYGTPTPTAFPPDRSVIPHGTCGDDEPFMNMYDQVNPTTGERGLGVIVYDWDMADKICIPWWREYKDMVASGKTGDALMADQSFVDYTGQLAYRGAVALGIPDSDLEARQGLRYAVAFALRAALESQQPADNPSGEYTHGYIVMPDDALIVTAKQAFQKDLADKKAALASLPSANSGDVNNVTATPRDVIERQARAMCTEANAPDIENCVTVVTDQYMALPNADQSQDKLKSLFTDYMLPLTPQPTNQPVTIPGDTSYTQFEEKIRVACRETKHPQVCESKAKSAYAQDSTKMLGAVQAGINAGNQECPVYIETIPFADLAGRSDVWNTVNTLQVWRVTNDNQGSTTTLWGVGISGGSPTVCIDSITNAPINVAGGTWHTRSDNVIYSASQYASQYAGGGYMTGAIIAKSSIYPADPGGGIYHIATDVTGSFGQIYFEIPIAGLHVSPVSGIAQIQPTQPPTAIPRIIVNKISITSTSGPRPTPSALTIYELASWASNQGFTRFWLQSSCGSHAAVPSSPVFVDDGRFSATVSLAGVNAKCYYERSGGYYFVITTDNMSGQLDWTSVGGLWVTGD